MTTPGSNSGIAADQLLSIIERVEALNGSIKDLNSEKSDVFTEAKSAGFEVKAVKRVIQLRAMDKADRQEFETMVDLYRHALGDLD